MSKSNYDDAYETESRRYPPFLRLSSTNMKILIGFVALYAVANIVLGIMTYLTEKAALEKLAEKYGDLSSSLLSTSRMPGATLAYTLLSVLINIVVTGFVINTLLGNVSDNFQVYCMVGIPIWSVIVLVYSRTIPNICFMLPLTWLWLMLIIEKKVHTAAQRRANTLNELEKESNRREARNAYAAAAKGENIHTIDDSLPDYGPIKGRDARYCPVCGIELGPDETECPMCGPSENKSPWG